MPMFEFAALFAVAALLILGGLAASIYRGLSLVSQIKAELAACPDRLEMRFTITETVSRWNDGTVVVLRPRQVLPVPLPAARAAA